MDNYYIDTKLNIYEAYENGYITESEKDDLLYMVESKHITKEFRYVINEDNGHLCKVVYDFVKDNITSNNLWTDNLDDFKNHVKKNGHSNYTSKGNKIVAIVDACTNKRLNEINAMPVIHNSGGDIMPKPLKRVLSLYKSFGLSDDEIKKEEEKLRKECPTGICPDPGFKFAIQQSKEKGQKSIKYKVGQIDSTDTYKTTDPRRVTKGMLNL